MENWDNNMPDIVIDHIKILSHFLNNFCSATYNKLNDFKYLFPLIILTHQMIFCFSYHCSSDFFNIKVSYIRCKFANIYGHLLEPKNYISKTSESDIYSYSVHARHFLWDFSPLYLEDQWGENQPCLTSPSADHLVCSSCLSQLPSQHSLLS